MLPTADILAFLAARVPRMRAWPAGRAERWWAWFHGRGLTAVLHERGQIIGVAAGRVTDVAHLADVYHHDEHGSVIYIVMAAADTPAARAGLWQCLLARVGPRPQIAYHRGRRGGKLVCAPWQRFSTLIHLRPNHPVPA